MKKILPIAKTLLKDAGLIWLGAFLFSILAWLPTNGLEVAYKTPFLVMFSLLDAVPCFLVFVVTMRLLKSEFLFFVTSWVVTIKMTFDSMSAAKNINLTQKAFGFLVYDQGEITIFGVFFKTLYDPVGIMALISTVLFIKYFLRRSLEKNKNYGRL